MKLNLNPFETIDISTLEDDISIFIDNKGKINIKRGGK